MRWNSIAAERCLTTAAHPVTLGPDHPAPPCRRPGSLHPDRNRRYIASPCGPHPHRWSAIRQRHRRARTLHWRWKLLACAPRRTASSGGPGRRCRLLLGRQTDPVLRVSLQLERFKRRRGMQTSCDGLPGSPARSQSHRRCLPWLRREPRASASARRRDQSTVPRRRARVCISSSARFKSENAGRLRYDEYLRLGYGIGSGANHRYTLWQMIMALVYPIILGLDRIETASFLRSNGTYQYLTGLPNFPDPQTLRRFLLHALSGVGDQHGSHPGWSLALL
jgi:hypothetical protein